jgi:hypothetical protein
MKHIKSGGKDGYVSLKLVSSMRSVRRLSSDPAQISFALKNCSTKLQVSEDGTRVCRIDKNIPARAKVLMNHTVVASELLPALQSLKAVREKFEPHGNIANIRVLWPTNPIPRELRSYLTSEEMEQMTAFVEFQDEGSVGKALKGLSDHFELKVTSLSSRVNVCKGKTEMKYQNKPNGVFNLNPNAQTFISEKQKSEDQSATETKPLEQSSLQPVPLDKSLVEQDEHIIKLLEKNIEVNNLLMDQFSKILKEQNKTRTNQDKESAR